MALNRPSKEQLNAFQDAAQSLKLYRRAELNKDDGTSLIEKLYVDPLPNNHVLNTLLATNTTFLVGRKGTGKSTIIQRAQHELRKDSSVASAYIDIKTLYESASVDPTLVYSANLPSGTLSKEALEKLRLHKAFLTAIINEIKDELKTKVIYSRWEKIKHSFNGTFEELFEGLDSLLEEARSNQYISLLGIRQQDTRQKVQSSSQTNTKAGLEANVSVTPEAKLSFEASRSTDRSSELETDDSDILMRVFNITEFVQRIKSLLRTASIQHLYVFIDDFSELPKDAMQVVVDTLLAPLNNWSEELIKLKVAGYPGRIYYGSIDKTKIDEVNLDLYQLYGGNDVGSMEEKAIDFTRRLVQQRLHHFSSTKPDIYFDTSDTEIWRALFYACMSNPRMLGYVLFNSYESTLLYGRPITITTIRTAASRYYDDKIAPYFTIGRFLQESFEERSSIFSLKELLETIVKRARELRSYTGSSIMRSLSGRPPTSHFYVLREFESLLDTLELNFFVTKYYEYKDRDGRPISVFALNYGLCNKSTIEFGRPVGRRELRTYLFERIFDYTQILLDYVKTNQEITCSNCGAHFEHTELPALKRFGMQCPECRIGICSVINLSRKYQSILTTVTPEQLLPDQDLGILQTLHSEGKPLFASDIAGELDCSYQLVGKRSRILSDRGLVNRDGSSQGRRLFEITDTAQQAYFSEDSVAELDLSEEDKN
jgi:DNA-binding MarR family transcriptional regulator/Cdc6-like AAA superfamily ATPase